MPSYVIKVAPDADQYVEWSTIVEAPKFWGTRAEMSGYLLADDHVITERDREVVEERLARADERGSSSWTGDGAWDADGFIFEQRGWLPRSRLAEFLASFDADAETFDLTLLDPFEDGADDG